MRLQANVNLNAEADRDELVERERFLREQMDDLHRARETLLATIAEIETSCQVQFNETFDAVKTKFADVFGQLFPGGEAHMWQTNPENLSETGIEIAVQPPGKKMTALAALSGGERAMTASALIFALIAVKPSPFYLLDEVDAALDDANVERLSTQDPRRVGDGADADRHAQQEDDGARAAHVRRDDAGARRELDRQRHARRPSGRAAARRAGTRSRCPSERRDGAALISVYDRTGVVPLARALAERGVPIYATGGTCAHLREHGIDARDVGELTGYPALFDGRVKTLHPNVFGGILYDRDDPVHRAETERHRIPTISTVVVNLYPFEATVAREGATLQEAIEQIDIGGVSLLRAASKNFDHVAVLSDPGASTTRSSPRCRTAGSTTPRAAAARRARSSAPPSTTARSRAISSRVCSRTSCRARWR